MLHIVKPSPIIVAPVPKHILSLARFLALDKTALVPVPVKESHLALAVDFVFFKLALISRTVCPQQHASTLFYLSTFDPVTYVFVTTFELKLGTGFDLS